MNLYKGRCNSDIMKESARDMKKISFLTVDRKGNGDRMYLLIQYPKCSTCQKAKKWLEGKNIDYVSRHIVEENPMEMELKKWIEMSGLPIKKFFNTSGNRYKELGLKDKLEAMSTDEQIALLASDGMLVKRPLLVAGDQVIVGFKEEVWEERLCEEV